MKATYEFGEGLLKTLASDEFAVSAGVITTAAGLRKWLLKDDDVNRLQRAVLSGTVREASIREWTSRLMEDFRKGMRFPHEIALSATAVALGPVRTDFAEEYLLDLARLEVIELPLAPQVARMCLTRRVRMPSVKTREFQFSRDVDRTASGTATMGTGVVLVTTGFVSNPVYVQTTPQTFASLIEHAPT